jgi:hypothetical protein
VISVHRTGVIAPDSAARKYGAGSARRKTAPEGMKLRGGCKVLNREKVRRSPKSAASGCYHRARRLQQVQAGTVSAFAIWSIVSVAPNRHPEGSNLDGLGASLSQALGPLFCELAYSLVASQCPLHGFPRRCCVPFTRSAFADELSAPSKGQKFGQSTPGKVGEINRALALDEGHQSPLTPWTCRVHARLL